MSILKLKQNLNFILFLISIFYHTNFYSQESIHETESSYSTNYSIPKKIKFIFSGNPKYINYYSLDLKEKINKVFTKKGISTSFIINPTDTAISTENFEEFIFNLKIENSKIIDEKNGYDRLMSYELSGIMTRNMSQEISFSFKSNVDVIHDITQQNENVAKYLLKKVLVNNFK